MMGMVNRLTCLGTAVPRKGGVMAHPQMMTSITSGVKNRPHPRQLAYLRQLGVDTPEELTRGQASDLINQARQSQRQQTDTAGNGVANGQAQPLNQELANRFAGLEQALATLTEALTNPDGTGRIVNGRTEEQPDESANGPIPDWLQEEEESGGDGTQDVRIVSADPDADDDGIADEDEVQNVNIVSAAPDLDRDGLEDKYETTTAAPVSSASTGTVRLEPYQESRRQVVHDTLARLEDPHSLAGQASSTRHWLFTPANIMPV
ncbi:MAG: hypothetical protein M5U34_45655 [Chloroflexi bacterium]|nr:hypothetical protein [Chloroflexota bacterium]